jgi:hypothetical protein
MKFASKDSANPFFKSKYADLASVWDAIRVPLSNHGLAVIQNPSTFREDGVTYVTVETILMHESGEWSACSLTVPIVGAPDPQKIGSATTYARRYPLAAVAGIAQADDDANSASGKDHAEPARMDESARANHQASIEGADTLDALKAVWGAAVKACGDDQDALRYLTGIKDAAKARIGVSK